ncbi:MAG: hypothetical protein Q9191_004893 [Dirinaria sp. TL-2023a]
MPQEIPQPFRAPHPPQSPSTPLPTLVSRNHFRSAATSSAAQLCNGSSLPPSEIFALLYTRLASLTLLNLTTFAAQESKALEDIHSPFYRDASTDSCILPWELRVLVVRLQGIAFNDARRGVVGYYDLARDARTEFSKAATDDEKRLWKSRLRDLGVRVGNAMIEMGDLGAAKRHFETLKTGDEEADGVLDARLALLCLKLGDIPAAEKYTDAIPASEGEGAEKVLKPLLSMAHGRYEDAVLEWRALKDDGKYRVLSLQNEAVCLLYLGKVDETTHLLEQLIAERRSFHALTFNLATVYELCTERSRTKKLELAETVAEMMMPDQDQDQDEGEDDERVIRGWAERGNADFKL